MKVSKILPILIIILLIPILNGCKDDNTKNNDEGKKENISNNEEVEEKGIPSPLSGVYGSKEKIERRPIAVVYDNHPKARWQAGLSEAEIVYEFLVEHPYTRYMGLFLLNDPELIGPIRSARPYIVTTAMEYDSIYVHVGGSEKAKEDIKTLGVNNIDGLYSDAFYRYDKTGKKAPNNMYSTMKALRNEQDELGYQAISDYEKFKFNKEDKDIEGKKAEKVLIKYNSENTTKYVYDDKEKIYKRYKDGKLHLDENNENEIIAKNIIIQQVKTSVIDNVGRKSIDLVGKGTGIYITNGKVINITWEKNSRETKTKYLMETGEQIKLNPGKTWIQIASQTTNIIIE